MEEIKKMQEQIDMLMDQLVITESNTKMNKIEQISVQLLEEYSFLQPIVNDSSINAIIGNVQSGETKAIMLSIIISMANEKIPVIILRNYTVDYNQFVLRFESFIEEFGFTNGDSPELFYIPEISNTNKFTNKIKNPFCVPILLANASQTGKLKIEIQDINLYSLLGDIMDTMSTRAKDKNLELVLYITPSLPRWIKIDPDRVKQVLINLLSNAIKFTEKGEVLLKVENNTNEILKFTVIDTGLGIPKHKQSQLFSKFMQVDSSSTRQYGGTGLGLAISKKLTEMMGGKITAHSVWQQGSTFSFTVKSESSCQISVPTTTSILAPLHGKRLLIVDTNVRVQQSVENFLKHGGIEVQSASNAPETIKTLRHAHDTNQPVDYVLIDIALPGMNGLELSKAIRADTRFSHLYIILITAQTGETITDQSLPVKISGYLSKPLRPDTLIDLLLSLEHSESRIDQRQSRQSRQSRQIILSNTDNQNKPNILVVEDNYINQQVIISMLNKLNCDYHLTSA